RVAWARRSRVPVRSDFGRTGRESHRRARPGVRTGRAGPRQPRVWCLAKRVLPRRVARIWQGQSRASTRVWERLARIWQRLSDPTRDTPEYIEHLFPYGLCWWEITGPVTMSGWLSTGEFRPLSLCQCHLLALVSQEQQRRGDVMARTPKNAQVPTGGDKSKALDAAMGQIDRNYGKGAIMRLGDGVREPIASIPTGSVALDIALGIGGLPRGRVVEIYGPESSGK